MCVLGHFSGKRGHCFHQILKRSVVSQSLRRLAWTLSTEVLLLQAPALLQQYFVSGTPEVETWVVADWLGPPDGAGVHSILWAIGRTSGQLPACTSPRKVFGRRFWNLGAAAFFPNKERIALVHSWKWGTSCWDPLLFTHCTRLPLSPCGRPCVHPESGTK